MMHHLRTYISICAAVASLFPCGTLWAQDAMASEQPTKKTTHLEASFDLLGAGQRILSNYGQYEVALRYNISDKYFPIIEAGIGTADNEEETTKLCYKTTAPYGRVGIDLNILKNKHDDYRFYLGLRAAYSSFKYDLTSVGTVSDPTWGTPVTIEATGQKCSYLWAELVAGVQVRIIGPVHLGWSVRYKNRLSQSVPDAGEPYYVPGFGKRGSSRLGGTFNIIVAF